MGSARSVGLLLLAVLLAVLTLLATVSLSQYGLVGGAVAAAITGVAAWMFASARYEVTLGVFTVYIGALDGYLKLKTGYAPATLGRDVLLYAIVLGAVARSVITRERLEMPPKSGWVMAWIAVVAVQVFNPANGTFVHSLAAVRPHLEFVPLFFVGYLLLRSEAKLRGLLALIVLLAAINGVVGMLQWRLTPDQLASWGPGYDELVNGTGDVSQRTYEDAEGTVRVRPPALGSDMGFGGAIGVLALPACLALLAAGRTRAWRLFALACFPAVAMGVVTSQARVVMLSAVVSVFAFAALAAVSRAALRTMVTLALVAVVAYVGVPLMTPGSDDGRVFDRYESITPTKATETTYEYRKGTLGSVPRYADEYPLGAGIGARGPASSFAGAPDGSGLNAESEPTFLLLDLGVPGVLVMLGFQLMLLGMAVRGIRRLPRHEPRLLLAGLAAPLFSMVLAGVVGITTATTPWGPFLWLTAGVLAFWVGRHRPPPVPAETAAT